MEKLTYTHNAAAAKVLAAFYETPPLAYVRSYGCQQNVNDGERIKGVLMDIGYGLCDKPEDAALRRSSAVCTCSGRVIIGKLLSCGDRSSFPAQKYAR